MFFFDVDRGVEGFEEKLVDAMLPNETVTLNAGKETIFVDNQVVREKTALVLLS